MTDPQIPTWRKPQTHYDLDECASLRADVTRLTQEKEEALRIAIDWSAKWNDASQRARKAEADRLLCQQERDEAREQAKFWIAQHEDVEDQLEKVEKGIAPVVEAMRTVERVAGQRSVDGPYDTLALIAAVEAKLAAQWADTLARLLAPSKEP